MGGLRAARSYGEGTVLAAPQPLGRDPPSRWAERADETSALKRDKVGKSRLSSPLLPDGFSLVLPSPREQTANALADTEGEASVLLRLEKRKKS